MFPKEGAVRWLITLPIGSMRFWSTGLTFALLVQLFAVVPTFAAVFPDVPDGHIYQTEVETLVNAQVINGNPDGRFSPDRQVNRAEMLKMLYRARGRTPDPTSRGCFRDVEPGSWYEEYVCDAAAQGYVQGYSDGTFRPANDVNRVEAIKMITQVFALPVEEITGEHREIVKFVDVSVAAWYTKYLYAAFEYGILPIAGQEGAQFHPDWPLLRGEAAAYIFNTLTADIRESREQTQRSSSSSSTSTGTSSSSSSAVAQSQDVTFPFSKSGKFTEKDTFSYLFSLARSTVASFTVSLQSSAGKVSCRLYLLNESGFSSEYYLGYQEGNTCYLKTALRPGNYQLQLQPTIAGATYDVDAEETTGDGNDGFVQAIRLSTGTSATYVLTENDFEDYFTFTVSEEKNMTVSASSAAQVRCLVYAMGDVDLFGFDGPQCNQSYSFPTGTYYVGVGRKSPKSAKQTYTIQLH